MTFIEPHPTNSEGQVKTLSLYSSSDFHPGSLVLCRNTAPLIAFAYQMLQRDLPCKILGRDIGAQLTNLVKKMRATGLEELLVKLESWRDREVAKAERERRSPERIFDQFDCLSFFVDSLDEDSRSVASLLAKIDLLFTDDTNGMSATRITLSTVHKAKGLEFETVFILDKDKYMPSRWAKQDWQIQQEFNLMYVAVTRAKENLFYVNSGCWREE